MNDEFKNSSFNIHSSSLKKLFFRRCHHKIFKVFWFKISHIFKGFIFEFFECYFYLSCCARNNRFIKNKITVLPLFFYFSRSEEHTSELQSRPHLVCRLLLEKKNTKDIDCFNTMCN